jgi:methyltransferase (TIGR00027 family)
LLHYIVRKRYLEDVARECLAEGIRQVVVLGAGFDTLAWRLHHEYSEVCFIELDHPATQQAKKQILQKHGYIPQNLRLLPLDLAQTSLQDSLLACPHYNPALPSLFIAEGLLMYKAC